MQEASSDTLGQVKLELMEPDNETTRKDWKALLSE